MPNSNANDLDLKRIQAYYSGTLIEEFRHTKINDLVQQYWDLLRDDDFFDKDQDPLHKEDPGQLFCFLDLYVLSRSRNRGAHSANTFQ